ncbi:antibiotic biosynthesis monooxygenase, partial [Streptomyces clavuligerus]
FTSRLSARAGADHDAAEERMRERVAAIGGTDPVEVKHYTAEDGERLAVVLWRDPGTLEAWRTDPEHRLAQRLGRERWYDSYTLYVAEVIRTSGTGDGGAASGTERAPDGGPR